MTKSEHMTSLFKSIILQINFKHKHLIRQNQTNLRLLTLITKLNLDTKNIVPIAIEQTTPFQLVSNSSVMTKINEKLTLDQNLLKNHLYNTFVLS